MYVMSRVLVGADRLRCRRNTPRASSVHRLTIHLQPFTDSVQALCMNRQDFALCSWPYIEQIVCAHAGTAREQMNQMSDGFWVAILCAVAPMVVDGHADFERAIIDCGRVEACRV